MPQILAENLVKEYRIPVRDKGLAGAVKALFAPKYRTKVAVDHINFSIEKGEVVGYIGPNGAGKSTTLKMLSGILYPSAGKLSVGGIVPYENRRANAMQIGVVFGNRSQLYWDLPVIDSFELNHRLYRIPDDMYKENVAYFSEIFNLTSILNQPVRLLSLGQKMRATIAAAMLHSPDILFLDEPTIGLDVSSKLRIRDFIREVNRTRGTTVILTSHDMGDIESLCSRIILISEGHIKYDGGIAAFEDAFGGNYSIRFKTNASPGALTGLGLKFRESVASYYTVLGNEKMLRLADAISQINALGVEELEIKNQTLEEIIHAYFG